MRGILSTDHRHDLGKFLFSFSSFWMYLWFSQYMLIWYMNNPEETSNYLRCSEGGWQALFLLNPFLTWVVPFVLLLPRGTKESPKALMTVAVVALVGRWVDLYLMILPALGSGPLQAFGTVEAGGVGIFLLAVSRTPGKVSLLPVNDSFYVESPPHGEMYGDSPSCQDGNKSGILQATVASHEFSTG